MTVVTTAGTTAATMMDMKKAIKMAKRRLKKTANNMAAAIISRKFLLLTANAHGLTITNVVTKMATLVDISMVTIKLDTIA